MKKTLFFFTLLLLLASAAQAQNGLSHKASKQRHTAIRSGNKAMKKGHISNAISYYRQALVADSNSARAQFNLAYAYAKRNQADSALVCYKRVTENASATPDERARAHYNAGNICLRQALAARDSGSYDAKSLKAAIEQYKASLRLDGSNAKAKHNLSLAKKLLRPESNQQNQQNQNQQNQNQQNKDQQNQNNQNNQQNQSNQNNQNNQNNQPNQSNQPNQPNQKNQDQRRREAEQMLNAMKNNEKQTMRNVRLKEMNKEHRNSNSNRIEKDW